MSNGNSLTRGGLNNPPPGKVALAGGSGCAFCRGRRSGHTTPSLVDGIVICDICVEEIHARIHSKPEGGHVHLRHSQRPPVEDEKQAQGRRLAEMRARLHATATEADKELGVSVPIYCAHENGERQIRPDMASFYAKRFNTTPEYILYGAMVPEK